VEGVPWMDDTDAIGPSCGGATFIIGFMFFQIDRLVLEDEDEASPGAHVVVLAIENLNNFIFLIVANQMSQPRSIGQTEATDLHREQGNRGRRRSEGQERGRGGGGMKLVWEENQHPQGSDKESQGPQRSWFLSLGELAQVRQEKSSEPLERGGSETLVNEEVLLPLMPLPLVVKEWG
jgi:hypothetical protein